MHLTEALGKDLYETLDIKAKVLKKQENKEVLIKDVRKPNVKLIVLQLTHKTGLMGKHNWQSSCRENIPFQLLKVGFFDDVKYLNTSEATDLKEIDDLPCIDLISPEITDDTIEGRCISVHIKWCVSCLVWNVSITETELGEETVTWTNCNITTLSSVCNTKLFRQLVIQTRHDKKILKFTCFDDAISSFLKSTDC